MTAKIILSTIMPLVVVLCVVLAICENNAPIYQTKYVAHRGYSISHVDSTEESFNAAIALPFYGIETDIRETADGVFVCMHDDEIAFADGTRLAVATANYNDIKDKPLKNDKNDEVSTICTFDRYLDICKVGRKVAVIELKGEFSIDQVSRMLKIIDAHYVRKMTTFIAFDYESLMNVRKLDADIELQYLTSEKGDKNIRRCLDENVSIDIHLSLANRTLINKFHKKGLKVNVWTVDSDDLCERLRKMNVDYLTSNRIYQSK